MALRILVFFPHNPWPPRSGAHHRALEMLDGLQALGASIVLASSTFTSETAWTSDSGRELQDRYHGQVVVHEATPAGRRYAHRLRRVYRRLRLPVPVNSRVYSPPDMRRWFSDQFIRFQPDVVMMNYAYWDGLITSGMRRSAASMIDSLDLITLHERMSNAVQQYFPPSRIRPDQINPAVLSETFFETLHLDAAPDEYRVLDRYTHCIVMTPSEAARVGAHTRHARVTPIPMTYPTQPVLTNYQGAALFPTGPNPLNVQGYLYFARRVLPLVQRGAPNFSLDVTGAVCQAVAPQAGVALRGFVEPLASLFASASFMICPLLGKTGQQVKIVEAMAHGLPVVATRAGAEGSPIQHGESGLVANDADEFAEFVVALWRDRGRCAAMGRKAQETIASRYSPAQLAAWLAPLFEARPDRERVSAPGLLPSRRM